MTASASPTRLGPLRIGIVAPAGVLVDHTLFERLRIVADEAYAGGAALLFHDQCRLADGHFAGSDEARMQALVEFGNRPDIDAMWMLRGGYGSNRIAEAAIAVYEKAIAEGHGEARISRLIDPALQGS